MEEQEKYYSTPEEVTHHLKVENNETYQKNSLRPVREVTEDNLRLLLGLFFKKASVIMGKEAYDVEEEALVNIIEFLQKEFSYLPVAYVYTAFLNGALGKYATGRLVPRTIYAWIQATAQEYIQKEQKKYNDDIYNAILNAQTDGLAYGRALIMKIDLFNEGKIDEKLWDKLDIKELAIAIKNGRELEYINSKITKI